MTRERFEERVFCHRFIKSVRRTGKGQFPLAPVGCPTKTEFCRRDPEGHYEDPFVAGAWWAVEELSRGQASPGEAS